MSNAITAAADTSSDIDWDMFKTPAAPVTRSLRGTGVKGTVRDDRLVADRDNKMALKPRRRG